jgi:uncharacterized protein involved in exopolysaccharide biosynthesis
VEQNRTTVTLRDFLTILFKHKWKILATFAAVVGTVTIVTITTPPIYQATSTVLVKFGRENIYHSEVGQSGSWISLGHEEMVNSEIEILASRDLAGRVVKSMGPEVLYPKLARNLRDKGKSEESLAAAAVSVFKDSLSVEGVKKSNVIRVSFQHDSPKIAAQGANLLVDFLKEKHLEVHSDPKSSFIEQELAAYQRGLKESEDNLAAYRQKYQTFSLPEQKTLLLQQRTNFDTVLKSTRSQVAELRQKLSALIKQMRNVPEDIPLSTVTDRQDIVDRVKNTLLDLQLKEQDLLTKYTENEPLVVNIRKEIALAKEYLERQEKDPKKVQTTGRNVVRQELEKEMIKTQAELAAQLAKASALSAQVGQVHKELQNLSLRENELDRLLREREMNEKNYRTYVEKAKEARILDDMNLRKMANVSVVQKADVPLSPIRPRKTLYVAFSFIFGVIGGIAFAFLSEYTAQRFTTPEQVEKRLNLGVLVALPHGSLARSLQSAGKIKLRHPSEVERC